MKNMCFLANEIINMINNYLQSILLNIKKLTFLFLFSAPVLMGQNLIHNFEFNGNLNDTKATGIQLVASNVASQKFESNPNGWTWSQPSSPGGGLILQTDELVNAESYSVGFRISFQNTGNPDGTTKSYKKILSFKGESGSGSDNGLYFNHQNLQYFPFGADASVTYVPNTFYDFVLTRTAAKEIKVYIVENDGSVTQVYSETDTSNSAVPRLVNGKHEFIFFKNDNTGSENTPGGTVEGIRVWDGPLSQSQIGAALSSVTTNDATLISGTTVTLNGEVNPQGSTSTFEFEYGLTTSYGQTINTTPASSSASSAVTVFANVTGLTPGTTYHYRLKSTNTAGDAFGSDKTFTTQIPGGVAGANLWLKADTGVRSSATTLNSWEDLTGTNTFTKTGTVGITDNAINFNHAVSLVSDNGALELPENRLTGNTPISIAEAFAVYKDDVVGQHNTVLGNTSTSVFWGVGMFMGFKQNRTFISEGTNLNAYPGSLVGRQFVIANEDLSPTAAPFTIARVNGLSKTVTSIGSTQTDYTKVDLTPVIGGTINAASNGLTHFKGQIAEIITFSNTLTDDNRKKITSYLAVKYGITLDSSVGSYVDSKSNVIWDNQAYWNDVFGVGNDVATGLNQRVSNSINSGLGNGKGISGKGNLILTNPRSFSDGDFIMVGHDNAALTEQVTDLPFTNAGKTRLSREWKVKHTNNSGTIDLTFDLNGTCLSGILNTDYKLLIDEDGNGDFTNGTVTEVSPSAYSIGILIFKNVTLNDGAVFTFQGTPATIELSSASTTNNQELCINEALVDITYTTTNLSDATVTGLPTGVTSSYNNVAKTLTISGTPTQTGNFTYTINTTSSQCSTAPTLTGKVTIFEAESVSAASSSPTVGLNQNLTPITHTTTGATGIGSATGLPPGITASYAADIITISGSSNKTGTYNYSIPLTGKCGNVSATGTIIVTDTLDTDGDGVIDTLDLDADNDGIIDTDEGFAAVTPAVPLSTYSETVRTVAANGPSISNPTNGYVVTDKSSLGVFAFEAVSRSENGSGGGIGTISYVDIDVDFAPREYVNNVQVSFKIGSQTDPNGRGYFDEGFYIEINGVVIVNFNYLQYNTNTAFNNKFDIDGGSWAPWNGEGNPELILDLQGGTVKLLADTKTGGREDALPLITNSKPNPIPTVDFEKGVSIGTAFNNQDGPGGIGIQTLTFSADVRTHRDTDGNGVFDYLETDVDNDGCGDVDEAYGAGTDTNGNAQYGDSPTLVNGGVNANGLVIAAGIAPSTRAYTNQPLDSNGDNIPDYTQVSKAIAAVTAQPQDTTVEITDIATFNYTVTTSGTGLDESYIWQVDNGSGTFTDITDGGKYSGATTSTLSIANPTSDMSGYKYRSLVSRTAYVCATPTISDEATLTVNTHPIVLTDDSYNLVFQSSTGNQDPSVLDNDTLSGAAINASDVTVSVITDISASGLGLGQITFNSTANKFSVANTLPVGTYAIEYQVCETADPTNCESATITINVLLDTDFDGVADVNDLDDDNDGILDTVEGICTLPSQMRLGYVTNSRDADGDNGYTLDGSNMSNSLRRKILNPANFGPNGIVQTEIILVPISTNPITETLLNSLNLDGLFIGGIDKTPTIESWLSDSEFAEIQKWSSNPEKTVLVAQASATKWGRILTPNNVNPDTPNAIGAKTRIFDGPFGKVSSFTQGGTFQAIFEADPSKTDVVLALDNAGDRVIIKDGTYDDILISDIDILTTLGGVTNGDGVSNNNDRLALNLIYTMIPLSSCPNSDKDIDGISNNLDLDSDGDSCLDVVEAYGVSADPDNDGVYGTGKPTVDVNGLVVAAGVSGNSYTNLPNDINNDGTEDFLQTSNIALSFKTHPNFPATVQSNTDTFLTFELNTQSTGLPPTYQWQINIKGTNSWQDLTNTATYNGVAKDTLFISNVTSSLRDNLYRVKIDNPTVVCGSTFESNSTKLSVTPDPIVANNDTISTSENNPIVLINNILSNDLLNAVALNNADVTITTSGAIPSGITLDLSTGELATDGSTPIGVYTFDYQICQNIDPTNCSSATISITILKDTDGDLVADINDLDDDNDGILDTLENNFSTDIDNDGILNSLDTDSDNDGCNDVNEVYGANTDTDNNGKFGSGNPAVDANGLVIAAGVTANTYNTRPSDNDNNGTDDYLQASKAVNGFTVNPKDHLTNINRSVTFSSTASVTGSGTDVSYQWQVNDGGVGSWVDLSDNTFYTGSTTANLVVTPNNSTFNSNQYRVVVSTPTYVCDSDYTSSAAVLSIISNIINANNDAAEVVEKVANSSIVNVLSNDLLNNSQAVISELTLSETSSTSAGISLDITTGNISLSSTVTAGIYFLEYRICENVDPTNCSNGIVTIVVQKDTDGDQIPDQTDPDIDNDGNPNSTDPNTNIAVANNDTANAKVGQAKDVDILANDDFLAGANTSITQVGGSATGTVSFNSATGILTYTPSLAEAGTTVTIDYEVTNTPTSVSKTATVTFTIDDEADLSISISVDKASPNVGENVVFTITLNNDGPSNASNVDVSAVIPSGYTYASAIVSKGNYDPVSGNWFIGDVSNNTPEIIAITANVNPSGAYTFDTEVVFADQTDPDSTAGNGDETEDDFAKVSVTPTAQANLVTVLTVNNATPNENDPITYQIKVTNNGPSAATNVQVNEATIPSGITYSSDDGSGDYNETSGIWTIGNLAAGNSRTLHIVGTIDSGEAGNTINQTIAATATENDTTTAGDVLSADLTVNQAALTTTITVDNATPNEGETVKYTITINNAGANAATGIELTSVLPSGLTYISDNGTGTYNSATGIWQPATIANGGNASLEITATVNSGTAGNTITTSVSKIETDQSTNNTLPASGAVITVKSINLVTVISVDDASPNEGQTIQYTINVDNTGTDAASNVTLTDILPTGVTYVSDNSGGSYVSGTGIWTIGTIASGASDTLIITATVDSGTAGNHIDNTITNISATETDISSTGDVLTASITVTSANLVTVLSINNAAPNVNDAYAYTITVTNNGPGNATGISLSNMVPSGLTYVSNVASVGTYNQATGLWTLGDLSNGNSATLTINTTVNSNQGNVTNTITTTAATGDQTDVTTIGDVLSKSFTPTSANLITVFSVDNPSPIEGDQVVFTIQVRNAGPSDETNVTLTTDNWPISGLTFTSDDSVGAYNSSTGLWTIGNIANGTIATLNITATVNAATGGNTYEFKANNPASGDQADLITAGDNLSANITVQQAKLTTSIFANNTSPNVGGTVIYTITVTNNGPSTDNNVSLTSLIPAGLTLSSNNPSQGTYNSGSGLWTIGSLVNGASETLQLTTTVDSGTGGSSITSTTTAAVGDQTDTSVTNSNLSETINVTSANLITVKTVNNPLPDEGDTIIYSINVTNNGPNDETNVTLIDNLPSGVTFVSATASSGTYTNGTGVWTIGNITDGDTETLNITATVDTGTSGQTITNTISQTAIGDQSDPTTAGDVLSADITVTVSDIVTVLTVNNNTPNIGDNVTYTINVTNNGVNDDTNVSLTTDIISSITGLTFVSDDAANYDETTGIWTIGGILTGETKTLNIIATVGNNTGGNAITFNTSAATGDQADPTTNGDVLSATINVTNANLVTTIGLDNANPNVGDTVKYTINVVNNGPNDETNVTLQDQLPSGVTFVSASTSNGSYINGTGVWTIGSIPKFNAVSLEILATVDSGTNGQTITNTISQTATGDQADPTTAGDDLSASLNVSSANLITVISVNNPTPNEGEAVNYTITVTNNGPNDESLVSLTSLLPSDINFNSSIPAQGSYNSTSGLWNIGTLAQNTSTTLTLLGTVATGAAQNNPITTTTTAAQGNIADSNTAGDVLSVNLNVTQSDLITSIAVDNPTPNEGDTVTYTITVNNNGPNNETNASLTSVLPTGLTFVSSSLPGAYNQATGLWTIGNITKNSSKTLTITATVNANTFGDTITTSTTAANGDQADPSTANDVLNASITIGNFTDVVLSKTVNNSTPNIGDTIDYTISVTNNGPANATNLVITDVLPTGLTFVSEIAGSGVWNASNSTWTLATLPTGETRNLTITASVNSDQGGNTITNTISNTQDQVDSNATQDDNSESITVTSVDLFATKTVDNNNPNEGDTVSYLIQVTNNTGSDTATNVAITDVLPTGLTYVNNTATTGSYNSGSGLWTIGTLASGANALLIVEAQVNVGTLGSTIVNTATNLVADQSDNNTTADDLSESITVTSTDLVTTKTVNTSNPTEGEDIIYTLTVTNNAGNNATNVSLVDRLPNGVTYKSDDSGAYNATSGIWTIGNLTAGSSSTINITATVNGGTANTSITNTTSAATADQADPTTVGDILAATINVVSADLVTSNSVNVTEVNVGDTVIYTLTATNNGPSTATSITLIDKLPNGVTYVSYNGSGSYDNTSGVWTIGTLVNGESKVLEISATVNASAAGKTVTNTISQEAQAAEVDPTTANDDLVSSFNVISNDLVTALTVDKANPNEGDAIAYTLTITNNGPSNATGVSITDNLPIGVTYTSHATSEGTYNSGSGVWSVGSIANGNVATLIINATVNTATGGTTITNTTTDATADNSDPDTTNNADSIAITIGNNADIVLTNSVDNASPNIGDTVTFIVTATNNGPTAVQNLIVQNTIPSGLTVTSVAPSNGTFTDPNWTIGTLATGTTETLTIQATIDAGTAGKTLTSLVSNTQNQTDSNLTTDDLSASLTVQSANLITSKTVNVTTPNEGDVVTYTISITNDGPSDATGVSLTDILPTDVTYTSDDSSGAYNSASGVWSIGNLANGATTSLNINATVNTGTSGASIVNITTLATADQTDLVTSGDDLDASFTVASSELVTQISVDNTTPNEGDIVTYSILVNNQGVNDATSISLTTFLPNGITLSNFTAPSGTTYNQGSGLWTIGDLATNTSKTLIIEGQVNIGTGGTSITSSTTAAIGDQTDPNAVPDILSVTVTVENSSDIEITKTVDNNNPNEGDTVTYTITATNKSGAEVTNFVLNDALPNGLTFGNVTASSGVWSAPNWRLSKLSVNDPQTLIVEAIVNTGTGGLSLTNNITHTQDQTDTNVSTDDLSETIVVTSSDLVTVKSVDNATPNEGDTINYTITVTNNGGSDATNVNLTDNLPAGVTYVSHSTSAGSYNTGSGLWYGFNLTNGSSETLTITATVNSGTGNSTITNTVIRAQSDQSDPTLNGDVVSASVTVTSANLVTVKTVSDNQPNEGDVIVYTIEVSNDGPSDATNVSLTDILPNGVTYVSDDSSGNYNVATGVWTIGTINNSTSETLNISVIVDAGTGANQTPITNTTTAATGDQSDAITAGDVLSATINVNSVDLVTVKSVDNNSPNINETIKYSISVSNSGPNSATNVSLTDVLPSGVTYVSDNAAGAYDINTGVWTIGTITDGQTKILEITAIVDADQGGNTITNTTTIAVGDEADSNNSTDVLTATINVTSSNLITKKSITTSSGNGTSFEGEVITYTISVLNEGPSSATNVSLTDVLPVGVTYITHTSTNGIYNSGSGNWLIGDINNNETVFLNITASVDVGQAGNTITNTVTKAIGDQADPTDAGNELSASIVIDNLADIVISKTVDNNNPNVGDVITFTLVATNKGPARVTNLEITDNLPAGLTFGNAIATEGIWTAPNWAISSLDSGDSAILLLEATVGANTGGQTLINSLTATQDQTDSDATADDLTETITVTSANLVTTKTVDLSTVNEGDTIVYTIMVENNGASDATNVNLTDVLPAGVIYTSDDSVGSYNPNTGLWILGDLAANTSKTLNITAEVDAGTAGQSITNTTSAAISDQADPTTANDLLAATIIVRSEADIVLTKVVDNANPDEGNIVTYTITATNNGGATATNLVVADNLPSGLSYNQATVTAGSWNAPNWTVGNLAPGVTETLTLSVLVEPGTLGLTLINTISNTQDQTDTNVTADDLDESITVTSSDLEVIKTVSNNSPNEGDTIVYRITIENNGPTDATGVSIEDVLPTGVTYVGHFANTGNYNQATGLWTIGSLNNGAIVTLTINATVDANTSFNSITNTTTNLIADQADPDTSNNVGSVTIVPGSSIDLSLTKRVLGNNTSPVTGDIVSYEIVVKNDGPNTATGIVVEDLLPSGLQFVRYNSSGIYDATTGEWNVGTLANNDTKILFIEAEVLSSGDYENCAEIIAADQTDSDSTPNNGITTEDDYACAGIVPQVDVDVVISKTVDNNTPNIGDVITYTIQAENNGPATATGLIITDVLPTGLTLVSATPSEGIWTSPNWNVGNLDVGTIETLTLQVRVDTNTGGQTIINTISKTQDQTDTDDTTDDLDESITVTSADISVVKTVDNSSPNETDLVVYQITVTNNGPDTATNVSLVDVLPVGVTYASHTTTTGAYNQSSGLWTIGTINNGDTVTLDISATVNTGTTGQTITNTTTNLTADQADLDTTNNIGSVSITPGSVVDVAIVKRVLGTTSPNVGDIINYEISVSNAGPNTATGVEVTDILPTGLRFISYNSSSTYDNATGIWNVGSVSTSDNKVLIIEAEVLSSGDYQNCAEVTSINQGDADLTNNESCVTITPTSSADLELNMSVNNNNPLVDTNIIFTLNLTNNGPSNATNVEITDLIPTGYSFISATPSLGNYDSFTGIWSLASVANNTSETLAITVKVLNFGNYVNTAEVTSVTEADPDSTPNNADIDEDDYAEISTISPNITVIIPQSFSPNGDNINETFEIPNLHVEYPKFRIEIINRYGDKVFKYSHNGNPNSQPTYWDGTSLNNGILPSATYFYTIYFNDGNRTPKTGWVYLRR